MAVLDTDSGSNQVNDSTELVIDRDVLDTDSGSNQVNGSTELVIDRDSMLLSRAPTSTSVRLHLITCIFFSIAL